MDKRWILILIIFLVGVAALYFVVDTSNTVGKAVVAVNTYTITVPETYNIENSETYLATVINRATGEKITVEDVGKGNDVDDRNSINPFDAPTPLSVKDNNDENNMDTISYPKPE